MNLQRDRGGQRRRSLFSTFSTLPLPLCRPPHYILPIGVISFPMKPGSA